MTDKIIDWQLAFDLVNNDQDFARELMEEFCVMLPGYRNQLEAAFQQENVDELKKIAHKIYGASCYIGTPRLKSAAKQLEHASQQFQIAYEALLVEIQALQEAV